MIKIINKLKIKTFSLRRMFCPNELVFTFPTKTDILIFDAGPSIEYLEHEISRFNSTNVFLRGESINFWCLMFAMMHPSFWLKSPTSQYFESFLKIQKPALVVTAVDNSVIFYLLKNRYPKIKFIAIQNGVRDLGDEFFQKISDEKKYSCDYIFCFGRGIAFQYKKNIDCNIIANGSFRNNQVKKSDVRNNNHIAFVSEWEPNEGNEDCYLSYANGKTVTWNDFFEPDKILLRFLVSYCKNNRKKLVIVGRQRDSLISKLELKYYLDLDLDLDWTFQAPQHFSSSYHAVDIVGCVVGIGSTLLLEAFARGKRVAIFNSRKFLELNHRPIDYEKPDVVEGKFWTDRVTESEFDRLIKFSIEGTNEEWEKARFEYVDKIMNYDPDNLAFFDLVESLITT